MNKKKIFLIFLILLIIVVLAGFFIIKYLKNKNQNTFQEYTPQEEINDEQLRQTIVNLYFLDKETQNLKVEPRLIDAAVLINNPYTTLVQLLIDGPKNENLQKLIPDGVEAYDAKINGDLVTLDMSEGFLSLDNNQELKVKTINSIVNTLVELTEVNKVKFLINGEENEKFNETYVQIK